MSEKSYVGTGYHLCPICMEKHDEVLLFDKRLKESLERDNWMGWSLCPEHEKTKTEWLALVECEGKGDMTHAKLHEIKRTGAYAMLKRSVVAKVFNVTVPDDQPLVLVEMGVLDQIKTMQEQPNKEGEDQ